MENYIGTNIPKKYYIGRKRVYKLYKGAALFWTSETPSGVTVTYNITSTTSPTRIAKNVTGFTRMSVDGGSPITPYTGYTFNTTGEHTVVWDLAEPVVPNSCFMHDNGNPIPISSVVIGEGVVQIGSYAFFFTPMTSITIAQSVTDIGIYAFTSNQSLGSVSLPSGLLQIGSYAFSNCPGIKEITIPESVKMIGGGAFSQTGLRTINIPGKCRIFSHTFAWCMDLHTVTFSPSDRNVLNLMETTFSHCTSLTSITTPDDCETIIGDAVFTDCTALKEVNLPRAISIGWENFTGCTSLTSVTFPDTVQGIVGGLNFSGCTSLTAATIPNAEQYELWLINGAGSLQRVQIGNTLSIDYNFNLTSEADSFGDGCTSLTRFDIVCNGQLMMDDSTTIPSSTFSTDLPSNGRIYYYQKSASETNINSQRIATAMATAIGRGWTAVNGGVWTGTPAE